LTASIRSPAKPIESSDGDSRRVVRRAGGLLETRSRDRLIVIATLALVLPVLAKGITRGEFAPNTDQPVHATTGLFFADVLRDWPIAHPIHYAYRWYAHYPALGLIHWPPFFHLVEGSFFLVFGPSSAVARLAVLCFGLFGLYYWFWLALELQNELAAVSSTIVLAFTPAVLRSEQTVMLEIPSLSLCIAASYYWLRYLREPSERKSDLYRFALLAGLALLTKQHSIYLAGFCLATLLLERKLGLLATRSMLWALAIVLLLTGPFYALAFKLHAQTIAADMFKGTAASNPFLFYPRSLPRQLGMPLLAFSFLGLLTSPWWMSGLQARLMGVWVGSCYLTFSLLAQKDPRYIIYWIPAFVFLAIGCLTSAALPRAAKWLSVPLLAALVGYQTWGAWHYHRPYTVGYEAVARRLMQDGNPGFILFDGELHGDLVFYIRAYDPERRSVVLRKSLYVTRVMQEYGSKELVHSRAEVENLLSEYGVRYVVVEDSDMHFKSQQILRDVLSEPPFVLRTRLPIKTNVSRWENQELLLYENPTPPPVQANILRVGMLTLPEDIRIPLDDLQIR
jgi:Dolichyl-phosphate-mannose-protein mannosyltransferase